MFLATQNSHKLFKNYRDEFVSFVRIGGKVSYNSHRENVLTIGGACLYFEEKLA